MRSKGVKLWVENGKVHYQAPAGDIGPGDLKILRERKAEIVGFFQESFVADSCDAPLVPRDPAERVPLTFAQMGSWNRLRRFGMHLNVRYCANAMRILGKLNVEHLVRAFDEVVQRHEILRMRIVCTEGEPSQEINADGKVSLEIVEVRGTSPTDREAELRRLVEELADQRCDVTIGPLFAGRLIRNNAHDHVLVVTIDHIIVDATSVGIVLRDALTMYLQCIRGLAPELPRLPIQFPDYAVWEQRANAAWQSKHAEYWAERLAGDPRTRIPAGTGSADRVRMRTVEVSVEIDRASTEALRKIGRGEHTTLVITVLAAYIACLSRWSQTRDVMVGLVLAGRDRRELKNAVGFFAFRTFLRVEVRETDRFLDLLRRTTREHYRLCNHQDFGRFALEWPTAEYTKTTGFNWHSRVRAELPVAQPGALRGAAQGIQLKPFPFKKSIMDIEWDARLAVLDGEPEMELWESADGISAKIWYREDKADAGSMADFGRSFHLTLEAILDDPYCLVARIPCHR
jgi:hypothetical protein